MTPEAITWIRQSHRHMAPWRMAAILDVDEADVQAVIDGQLPRPVTPLTRPPRREQAPRPAAGRRKAG